MAIKNSIRDFFNLRTHGKNQLFSGEYEILNNVIDLNNFNGKALAANTYWEIQKEKLKEHIENQNKTGQVEKLNEFLKSISKFNSEKGYEDLFSKLINTINKGTNRYTNKNFDFKNEREFLNEVENILNEINKNISSIDSTSGKIPVKNLVNLLEMGNVISNNDKELLGVYANKKGEFIERVGESIIQQLMQKIGGEGAIQTGYIKAVDSFFGESVANQIIEDIIYQFKNMDKKEIEIHIKNTETEESSKQFESYINNELKKIESDIIKESDNEVKFNYEVEKITDIKKIYETLKSGKNFLKVEIILSDDIYKEIQKTGIMIQAKSNNVRHLVNSNSRKEFSIISAIKSQQPANVDKIYTYLTAIQTEKYAKKKLKSTGYSKEFLGYLNYLLSYNIGETVYARNDFYFTLEGFKPLYEMMKENKFYIQIQCKKGSMTYEEFLKGKFKTSELGKVP